MKFNQFIMVRVILTFIVLLGFASCSKNTSNKNVSSATGWKINDPNGGFQHNSNFTKQETAPGLVLVEGGTFTMGKVQDDPMHDWNNSPSQQHVQSFYMDETEVTNKMYSEYLFWLKSVYPPSEDKYKNIYEGALPDTLVWRNRLGYNETMTNNYLRHPAYSDYPVVGVNWIQATEFAVWRTDRVNENVLEREGYMKKGAKIVDVNAENNFSTEAYLASPSSSFGGNEEVMLKKTGRTGGAKKVKKSKDGDAAAAPATDAAGNEPKNVYAQRSNGILLPEYRLPTEAEWEYAAAADVGQREYNIYRGQKKYPWSGSYTRSGNRTSRGDQLANFKQGKGDYGGIAGWSDDGADITGQVKSYAPNDFGLYDMAGNVAEWVQDVYRPIVDDEANDFNYFRGNVYTKNKIGDDGKIEIVTSDNIKYDTLSNGKIIARNKPGELAKVAVDDKETYLRQNFDKSNEINYRDGDKQSTRFFNFNGSEDDSKKTKKMYDSPQHKISKDSTGKIEKSFDKSSKRTTLIGDDVRVYKGGSWRDRAYWLDPAQRRYCQEDIATDYIGFRCAMSRVGSKSDFKKRPRN
jgi:gliding motility-associated lipoprotein GldJ